MFGGMGMGDLMKMVSQFGKIKENMVQAQSRSRARTVIGEAGAGLVKAEANGVGEILAVHFDPDALKDPESLGTLTTAAVNLALHKSREVLLEETRAAMGGIDLPPDIMNLLGERR